MKKFLLLISLFSIACASSSKNFIANSNIHYKQDRIDIKGLSIELEDNTNYEFTNWLGKYDHIVDYFSYGDKSIGTLSVNGDIQFVDNGAENNAKIIGSNNALTFSFNSKHESYINQSEEKWNISDETDSSVNGIKLDSEIKKGCLIIQEKSQKNGDYKYINSSTDIFNPETNFDFSNLFLGNCSVLNEKFSLRFIFAYEMRRVTSTGIFGNKNYEYKNFVEIYEASIVKSKYSYSLSKIDDELEYKNTNYANIAIQRKEIEDNCFLLGGFILKSLDDFTEIKVINGNYKYPLYNNSIIIEESGDYDLSISNKYGGEKETYKIKVRTYNNNDIISSYFGNNHSRDDILGPCFGNYYLINNSIPNFVYGDCFFDIKQEKYALPLVGNIKDENDNIVLYFDSSTNKIHEIAPVGSYTANFVAGDTNNGDSITYSFKFNVVNKEDIPEGVNIIDVNPHDEVIVPILFPLLLSLCLLSLVIFIVLLIITLYYDKKYKMQLNWW